jgi:hypothetical protein
MFIAKRYGIEHIKYYMTGMAAFGAPFYYFFFEEKKIIKQFFTKKANKRKKQSWRSRVGLTRPPGLGISL